MPVIQREIAVAAGDSVDNAVAGSAFEFARRRQLVSIALVASATGAFFNINSGGDVVAESSPAYVKTSFPIIPDEFFYTDVMEAMDRLVIQLRNPTGGSITFRLIVQLQDI